MCDQALGAFKIIAATFRLYAVEQLANLATKNT